MVANYRSRIGVKGVAHKGVACVCSGAAARGDAGPPSGRHERQLLARAASHPHTRQEVDVSMSVSQERLDDDPGISGGSPPRIYQCMYCGTTFPHQSKLTRHILSHSLETLKYREQRGIPPLNLTEPPGSWPEQRAQEPPDPNDLLRSEPTPMDMEEAASQPGGVVLCKFCGKSFPDVAALIAHLPAHTGDRPFKCEFCGKAFKLRHHMKDHCRVHTGERPFRCSLCGKTFSRSTILKAHEKTHYPKYVRKFLSPSPLDTEDDSPH